MLPTTLLNMIKSFEIINVDKTSLYYFIMIGDIEILNKHEAAWDEWMCRCATRYGQLECLKYLHENGCPWDELTCEYGAQYGQLECLKYLHENKCPWDEWTCETAAQYGQLECLKYAHENGSLRLRPQASCPIDISRCLEVAKENNHQHIVEYLSSF